MYDRAGLSTKCTLIKTGFKNLRAGTEAEFRPFVDALASTQGDRKQENVKWAKLGQIVEKTIACTLRANQSPFIGEDTIHVCSF